MNILAQIKHDEQRIDGLFMWIKHSNPTTWGQCRAQLDLLWEKESRWSRGKIYNDLHEIAYYKEDVTKFKNYVAACVDMHTLVTGVKKEFNLGHRHLKDTDEWVSRVIAESVLYCITQGRLLEEHLRQKSLQVNLRRLDKREFDNIYNQVLNTLRPIVIANTMGWDNPPKEHGYGGVYDDTTVFYLKDPLDALRGRVSKMAYTKYFQQFCGADQEGIRNYQNLKRSAGQLLWAKTRLEVAEVYETGPSSCMSYDVSEYYTDGIRPTEVYGTGEGGDVAVAYIKDLQGNITARAVCNMKDKKFPTVYGDDALRTLLEQEGFENDCYALDGCRILRLTNNKGDLIVPYIDGNNFPVNPNTVTVDNVDYVTVDVGGDDDWAGNYETGLANCEGGYDYYCDCCGDGISYPDYYDYAGDPICDDCWCNNDYCEHGHQHGCDECDD